MRSASQRILFNVGDLGGVEKRTKMKGQMVFRLPRGNQKDKWIQFLMDGEKDLQLHADLLLFQTQENLVFGHTRRGQYKLVSRTISK